MKRVLTSKQFESKSSLDFLNYHEIINNDLYSIYSSYTPLSTPEILEKKYLREFPIKPENLSQSKNNQNIFSINNKDSLFIYEKLSDSLISIKTDPLDVKNNKNSLGIQSLFWSQPSAEKLFFMTSFKPRIKRTKIDAPVSSLYKLGGNSEFNFDETLNKNKIYSLNIIEEKFTELLERSGVERFYENPFRNSVLNIERKIKSEKILEVIDYSLKRDSIIFDFPFDFSEQINENEFVFVKNRKGDFEVSLLDMRNSENFVKTEKIEGKVLAVKKDGTTEKFSIIYKYKNKIKVGKRFTGFSGGISRRKRKNIFEEIYDLGKYQPIDSIDHNEGKILLNFSNDEFLIF